MRRVYSVLLEVLLNVVVEGIIKQVLHSVRQAGTEVERGRGGCVLVSGKGLDGAESISE